MDPELPVEDVLEKHLKLGIEFDDMHERLDIPRRGLGFFPDIIGGMFFQARRIVLDESLDPEVHPSREGRYRFTLAHEGGGHWRLHRHQFLGLGAEAQIMCRSTQPYNPAEWQANFYASCLLMPRPLVYAAWHQIVVSQKHRLSTMAASAGYVDAAASPMEKALWLMADRFLVSPAAMRIRLERLGLIAAEPAQHAHAA